MAYIGQQPVVGRYILLDQISGGFNGTTSGFTMSTAGGVQGVKPGLAQNVLLSLGGVIQQPGVDYTISGSGITFTTPPVSGTTFFATVLGDAQSVGTPSDGTVTPASIAAGYDFAFPNINVTGVTTIASGSAATPSLSITGDADTGFLSPAANTIAVSTSGGERLRIDSNGVLIASHASVDGGVIGTNDNELRLQADINADGTGFTTFYTGLLERVRINNSGQLLIGTTTEGAANADNLTIADSGHAGITIRSGTSSKGAVFFSDATSGSGEFEGVIEYNQSNNNMLFFTSGSEGMRIDSSGRVGIGTSSPGSFNSTGDDLVVSSSSDTGITINAGTSSSANIFFADSDGNSRGQIRYFHSSDSLSFASGGSDAMRIDSSGRVGIGTSSPSQPLTVNGIARFENFIEFAGSISTPATAASIYRPVDNNLAFGTASAERMRIDSSGRIGIGNTSPGSYSAVADDLVVGNHSGAHGITIAADGKLLIGATSGSVHGDRLLQVGRTDRSATYISIVNSTTGQGALLFADTTTNDTGGYRGQVVYAHDNDSMRFWTSATERIRLDSSGNLGIGTTSPTQKLDVRGTVYVGTKIGINTTSPGCQTGGIHAVHSNTEGTPSFTGGEVAIFQRNFNNAQGCHVGIIGGTAGTSSINFGDKDDADIGIIQYGHSDNSMRFFTNTNERMRIDSSGRLLVGHSSLTGDSDSAHSRIVVNGNTQSTSKGGILSLENTAASIGSVSNGNQIGQLFFKTETGEEFGSIKVEAQGNASSTSCPARMMFSTTTANDTTPTERFRISHDGETTLRPASYGMGVRSIAGSSSVNTAYFGAHSSSSMSTGTITFEVYTNGNVKNTNNSYGQLSDQRLKENIIDAPSQWDDIKSLQIRKYNFRDGNGYDTHTQIGLVAQEVEAVCPGLVQETPVREDAAPVLDAEGNELEATKSLLTSVLYMKAVKALQEAQTRIETLETQHADLLARVTALES